MSRYWSYGPNRYICDVLGEMRKMHETRNYAGLLSLIEEAQTLANRMEAALHDHGDYESMLERKAELKQELKEMQKEKDGKTN